MGKLRLTVMALVAVAAMTGGARGSSVAVSFGGSGVSGSLTLTYGPEALEEVRDLMHKEQTCCAFLAFDLKSNSREVVLTITAPQEAAEATDLLFDHFAPELAASNLKETA